MTVVQTAGWTAEKRVVSWVLLGAEMRAVQKVLKKVAWMVASMAVTRVNWKVFCLVAPKVAQMAGKRVVSLALIEAGMTVARKV